MPELDQFLQEHAFAIPNARTSFATFYHTFRGALPPAQRKLWPRRVLLQEMQKRYPVGRDSKGVLTIGGLSLDQPPQFTVDNGRLRLAR